MADPYNLQKRGRYWVPDFTLHGVRVHKSTKHTMKADAVERCDRWAQEIRDRIDGVKPKVEIPTLATALEKWEAANRNVLSDKHIDGTADKLRLHCQALLVLKLDELTTEKVEAVRSAYLSTPGPTGRTHKTGGANSLVKALNTVMGWASARWDVPARPYKLRKVREKRVPRRVVPITDTQAFLEAVDAPYKGTEKKHSPKAKPKNPHVCLAIKMMLALGLREREALHSRWEWIDWSNRTYYAGETKNGQVRLIPIPKWFLSILQSRTRPESGMGLIMPDEDGKPHAGQFTKKVLYLVGKDLKLGGLTPHRLRATFATNQVRAGTDIRKVQVWLDHANIETTMLYVEYVEEGGHAAQDRVEELMGLAPQKSPKSTDNLKQTLENKEVNN